MKIRVLVLSALLVTGLGTVCQAKVQRAYFTTGGDLKTVSTEALLRDIYGRELDGIEIYVNGAKKKWEYHLHATQPLPHAGAHAPRVGQIARFVPGVSDHGPASGGGGGGHGLHPSEISAAPTSGVMVHVLTFNSNGTTNDTTTLLNAPHSVGDIFFSSQGMIGNPNLRTITFAGGFVTAAPSPSPSVAPSGQWISVPGPFGIGTIPVFVPSASWSSAADWGWDWPIKDE